MTAPDAESDVAKNLAGEMVDLCPLCTGRGVLTIDEIRDGYVRWRRLSACVVQCPACEEFDPFSLEQYD